MSGPAIPSLKCVVAWSNRRRLCDIVGELLVGMVGEDEVRLLGDGSYVVNTAEEAAAVRDVVQARLSNDEAVLVVDFEKWSGYGESLDDVWLLRRGH